MKARCGFTLIELLVAATVTVVLAGFIFVIVKNVGLTWTRTSGRLGADARARIVLDQLEVDLQGALFRDDGSVSGSAWFAVDILDRTNNSTLWQPAARNVKPIGGLSLDLAATRADLVAKGNFADTRYGTAGCWLRFVTTKRGTNADAANTSAPVAVSYQIVRYFTAINPANTNTAYLLYRAEVRPGATGAGTAARPGVLESGYNIRGAAYTTGAGTSNNTGAVTGDPLSITRPGSASQRNLDAVMADNVIDFGLRCYVRDPSLPGGLRLIFPASNENGQLSTSNSARLLSSLPSNTPATSQNFNLLFPDVVDIVIRVLTDDGAALIANLEKNQTPALVVPLKYNNNAQAWWWGVAQENSRVYTRRIVIHAQPL